MSLENNNSETFAGEQQVAAMLNSLPTIDAPGDFNAHVRARIARGRTRSGRSWMPVLVRAGVPSALLVLVAAYFGFTALYRPGGVETSQSASPVQTAPAPQPEPPVVEQPIQTSQAAPEVARAKPEPSRQASPAQRTAAKKEDDPNAGGGSMDIAAGTPRSISLANINAAPSPLAGTPPGGIAVKEVLSRLGIVAAYSGGGWRISGVSGIAARSGLKAGDIVLAINGNPASPQNVMFPAGFRGSNLRISRNGSEMQIALR